MDELEQAFKDQAILIAQATIAAQSLFNALAPVDKDAKHRAKIRLRRALRRSDPKHEIVRLVLKTAYERVKR